jgi:hypothetical protein
MRFDHTIWVATVHGWEPSRRYIAWQMLLLRQHTRGWNNPERLWG